MAPRSAPSSKDPPVDRMDAQNPPHRMGGFSRVVHDDGWRELLECAESFFQPHVGCSCASCDKRKTRDRLCDAIETMKQMSGTMYD